MRPNKSELLRKPSDTERPQTQLPDSQRLPGVNEKIQAFAVNLMQNLVVPTFVLDHDCNVLIWNQACERLTGIPASEVIGTHDHWKAFYPEPRMCLADIIAQGRLEELSALYSYHAVPSEQGFGFKAENWCVMPRIGTRLYLAIDAGPIYDEDGQLIAVVETLRDMTERKLAEQALIEAKAAAEDAFQRLDESTKNLRVLSRAIEQSPVMNVITDVNGVILYVNPKFHEITGYASDEAIGKTTSILNAEVHPKEFFSELWTTIASGREWHGEMCNKKKNGEIYWERVNISPVRNDKGEITEYIASKEDITDRKQKERELRIAAIAFETQEGITVTNADGIILKVNSSFTAITGYTAEEAIGKTPRLLSSGRHDANFYAAMWEKLNTSGSWEGEIWNRRKNGEIYPEFLTISAVKDSNGITCNYVGTFSDITMSKAAADEIKHLAFYDPLTRLPNRRLLIDRLRQALASIMRSDRTGALLFIDLDNFKTINDSFGHAAGDRLLQEVAERLKSCVRAGDTVARLGGDEFVLVLENLSKLAIEAAAQAEAIGEKVISVLNHPYHFGNKNFQSTPSIGIVLFNGQEKNSDDLFRQADIAMYQAKKAGRNTLRFFDPKMQEAITTRSILESELREALLNNQFKLYYQIQVDSELRPLGAEVLIRWVHPERGQIPPAEFIPIAEEVGLIYSIGWWVLETACAQIKTWQNNDLCRNLILSVNVSAKQLHHADFADQVQACVQHYGINPALLKLELTESMLLENIEATIAAMTVLRNSGIGFSLDDFGTGYSSLQYLKRLPLDQLKIDQSFVRDIVSDSSDRAIVRTIIAMAQSLNLNVIAEGVETDEQRQLLFNKGCTHYQGYLFSKPVPIEQFEALLASNSEGCRGTAPS